MDNDIIIGIGVDTHITIVMGGLLETSMINHCDHPCHDDIVPCAGTSQLGVTHMPTITFWNCTCPTGLYCCIFVVLIL